MARPKAFSPDDVLAAALEVFRCQGYEATSIQDLVDATGLSRSSLYDTFGDKHALYLSALDRYRQLGQEHLARVFDCEGGGSPLGLLRAYLESIAAEGGEGDTLPAGCLMTKAAAEVGARDPETARRAHDSAEQLARSFAAVITKAQAAGEVPSDRDSLALGRFLASTVFGLRGLQNARASSTALNEVIELTMETVCR